MMSYLRAESIEHALTLLKESASGAKIIAGGTDLFLQELPGHLIDIGFIGELKEIKEEKGQLHIGAALTHTLAANSKLIKDKATALAEASSLVGSPQIRNIGTLGGNVINAAPAADAAVALVALGAQAVLIDLEENIRCIPVDQLYSGFNCTSVDCSSEMLLKFIINTCEPGEGTAFVRFAARRALALPMANAAARIKITDGVISEAYLVAAPVKPAPTRLTETETLLHGEPAEESTWLKAELSAAGEVAVRGSLLRCSADYRKHLVGLMAGRALRTAASRAVERKEVR
ncbi:MAG: FAD binding domain-containing protein [Firmicutes bacterium]|nr:FAD binding domain-containing protein [Bacillota bacterium]